MSSIEITHFVSRAQLDGDLTSPFTLSMIDAGLDLSPFKCLREVSLTLAIDRSLRSNLPRFSPITSGRMSKITIVARPDSQAKEISSLFGRRDE